MDSAMQVLLGRSCDDGGGLFLSSGTEWRRIINGIGVSRRTVVLCSWRNKPQCTLFF